MQGKVMIHSWYKAVSDKQNITREDTVPEYQQIHLSAQAKNFLNRNRRLYCIMCKLLLQQG